MHFFTKSAFYFTISSAIITLPAAAIAKSSNLFNNGPSLTSRSAQFRALFEESHQAPMHAWPRLKPSGQLESSLKASVAHTSHILYQDTLINNARATSESYLKYAQVNSYSHFSLQMNWHDSATSYLNPHDSNFNVDGSEIGFYLGNWNIWAGAVDRWWGPSWQSPLLISNNARPVPTINIDRIDAKAPTLSLLKWIGPWSLNTFLGRLESHRTIDNPVIWGMRFSMMPIDGFELGFNRTAMFGGEGRSVTVKSIYNVILGDDNAEDQPGNQLGSVDLSYRFAQHKNDRLIGHEFYLELAGEDESNAFPAKKFGSLGYTGFTQKDTDSYALHYLAEYSNTLSDSFGDQPQSDITYTHHIYQSGYTYYGQVIGSPLGRDTESFTIGLWFDDVTKGNSLPKNAGFWISRKNPLYGEGFYQLNLWAESNIGSFQYKAVVQLFDKAVDDRIAQNDSTHATLSLSVSKALF